MNRTIRAIAAAAAVYPVVAFITWEFNPVDWTQEGRLFTVFAAGLAAFYAYLSEDMF